MDQCSDKYLDTRAMYYMNRTYIDKIKQGNITNYQILQKITSYKIGDTLRPRQKKVRQFTVLINKKLITQTEKFLVDRGTKEDIYAFQQHVYW